MPAPNAVLRQALPVSLPRSILSLGSALLVSLIVSILITIAYSALHSLDSRQDRGVAFQQYRQLLKNLEAITSSDYENLARLIPGELFPRFTGQATGVGISKLSTQEWLQQSRQIEFIGLYSPLNDHLISHWSPPDTSTQPPVDIDRWLPNARNQARALTAYHCTQGSCSIWLVYPANRPPSPAHQYTVVMALPMSVLAQRMHRLTGKTVAILRPVNSDAAPSANGIMANWRVQLSALFHNPGHDQILQSMSHYSALPVSSHKRIKYREKDSVYEAGFFPLPDGRPGYFVIVDQFPVSQIPGMHQWGPLLGISFVICLGLLALLNLLLTHYGLVSSKPKTIQSPCPSDAHTAAPPEHAQKDAEEEQKKRQLQTNQELVRQIISANRQRDHLNILLDQIQSIVLTLDQAGNIQSINGYGVELCGFSREQLLGKPFTRLYPSSETFAEEDLQAMIKVADDNAQPFSHESRLLCADGSERIVLWQHIRLDDTAEAPLLAVGLDITNSKNLERKLCWLAEHDSLTSLHNRRGLEAEMEHALYLAQSSGIEATLLYIDLDNFKDINDSCGHQVGDHILRKVARTLKSLVDKVEKGHQIYCARLGGDEFAMLLHEFDQQAATELSQRLLEQLNQIHHQQDSFQFQLSCSIGIASFATTANSIHEVLGNADFAMYQAKMQGRNQYYLYRDEDSRANEINQRVIWKDKIEHALANDSFVLHFQPIMNIQTRSISHYETLIRMRDGDKLIYPDSFINIAERLDLITRIDHFILDNAIRKQSELLRQGHDVTLAINLSGKAFDDPDLAQLIESKIIEHNARAENLIFEITETAAVSDLVAAEKTMLEIQSLGCQFSLDDFGVGFSSFYYLRELPVEFVKIDGSFIKNLPRNTDNQVLVNALSEVAIGFNKLSVAEFVDSMQTLRILQNAKVNYAQGFFIGKPSERIPVDPPAFHSQKSRFA
jgi:diguanylate cyclase (GGDEF)-like protein/PAS domain S-box-containing protein